MASAIGDKKVFILFLGVVNIAAWTWALINLNNTPSLIGAALLAYSLGLRHALDADHLAAIDNVTRKLMQDGSRPITIGFYFALGHSLVVVLGAMLLAFATKSIAPLLSEFQVYGEIVSSLVSIIFLLAIGIINFSLLADTYKKYKKANQVHNLSEEISHPCHMQGSLLSRLFRPLFGKIYASWHMMPLGFLFGLGFESATEVALLSTTTMHASQGTSFGNILLFPCLFTVGMLTVDAIDGMLMMQLYDWANVKPARRLYYNMVLTLASTLVAVVVSTVGAFSLLKDYFQFNGGFWNSVQYIHDNYNTLGYFIIAMFVLCWACSRTWLLRNDGDSV